jgi:Xaa-Pro aminopeptidase
MTLDTRSGGGGALRAGSLAAGLLLAVGCQAFAPDFAEFDGERVRDLRDRAAQRDAMLELRLELLLPGLMEDAGLDCWLVVSDGQHGDPLVAQLTVSATHLEGKGALLLCRGGGGLDRFALGRGFAPNAAIYEVAEPSDNEALEMLLNDRLAAIDPQRIGIDDARSFAPADGLSASDARWLRERLADDFAERLVSSRPLVEDFLATQLDVEAPLLAESTRLTAAILEEVLSDRVVVAAGTSLADLDWAVRTRAASIDAGLPYPPRPVVYRPGATLESERRMEMDLILQPGDLVFLSAGIDYLGYANRVGRWAYLLPTGERQAPAWVEEAMGQLADAAGAVVGAIAVGQSSAEVHAAAAAAVAALPEARVAVDRTARLHEGAIDPTREAAVSGSWRPDYRLAADTGLAIVVEATVTPPGANLQPFSLFALDTALVDAAGARFVVAPQRTPLLID